MKFEGDKLINYICNKFVHCDNVLEDVKSLYEELYIYGIFPLQVQKIEKQDHNKVIYRMKQRYPFNFNNLKTFLRDYDAVISGSFPLQCYLDERWLDSDIDIYINYDVFMKDIISTFSDKEIRYTIRYERCCGVEAMEEHFKYNIEKMLPPTFTKVTVNYIHNYAFDIKSMEGVGISMKDDKIHRYGISKYLKFVINIDVYEDHKKQNIDIILVDCPSRKYVSMFDFTFTSIFYDGYGLYIYDEDSIINKTTYNNYNIGTNGYIAFKNNIERINKYMIRGFYIYINDKYISQNKRFVDEDDYTPVHDLDSDTSDLDDSDVDVDDDIL